MGRARHAGTRRIDPIRIAAILLLAAAGLTATIPTLATQAAKAGDRTLLATHADMVATQQAADTQAEWDAATAYNQRLASRPPRIGAADDPWATGGATDGDGGDDGYDTLLDQPADGIMSSIDYPRLAIRLPIRHGTNSRVLADGAGHLHGTSLPVGGKDTHTVISAHSGLAGREYFDRLSMREARTGDLFHLHTLGHTLTYKVTSIQVVNPDDLDSLDIQPGKDLATLLTCTPYGVNNKRLLVTGERVPTPQPAPTEGRQDNPVDPHDLAWPATIWAGIGLTGLAHHIQGRRNHHANHDMGPRDRQTHDGADPRRRHTPDRPHRRQPRQSRRPHPDRKRRDDRPRPPMGRPTP